MASVAEVDCSKPGRQGVDSLPKFYRAALRADYSSLISFGAKVDMNNSGG